MTIFEVLPLGSALMYDMAVASGVKVLPCMNSIVEVAASKTSWEFHLMGEQLLELPLHHSILA